MRFSSAALLASALLLAGCGTPESYDLPPELEAATVGGEDTSLGIGDVFAVRVYGEPDLSQDYRVGTDGTIDFPLLGRIEVAGLDPSAVAEVLRRSLSEGEILVDPQVSIFMREVNSKRVSVVGAVARAGTFPLGSQLTVIQAISLAGGFTNLASRNDTVVTRRSADGDLRRYRVRVDDVSRGRRPDFLLRAGDIVYVPQRAF